MLNDSLPTEWTRRMFWICMMNGASGHTYGANGIWQCNRPGEPHGKSPHGGSYGKIPWNEAMRLPGSKQLGLAKALFMKYQWQQFEPHSEWVRLSQSGEPNEISSQPQATGIPDTVRIIFVPESKAIQVIDLGKNRWSASYFDPVTGEVKSIGPVSTNDAGIWACPPPAGVEHDWVVVLESEKSGHRP
jgi:hypothetical protein